MAERPVVRSERLEHRLHLAADFGWAMTAGAGGIDRGNALAIDPAGNLIVAGVFNGGVDFDPSIASKKLATSRPNAAFIARYASGGTLGWALGLSGSGEQNIQAVSTDAAGNVYAAGYFSGTLDFDPGTGTHSLTAKGKHDAFVLKLTPHGNFTWARRLGGTGDEGCTGLDVDRDGNAYAIGMFDSSGDYDPGTGTKTLSSRGSFDIFLTKLNAAGQISYAVSVGGSGEDFANGVSVDSAGRPTIAGTFRNSLDLDPSPTVRTANSAGGKDVFVLALSGGGGYRFGKAFGGSADDQASDIRVDSGGNAVVVGQFAGTADFDPSAAKRLLTSAGSTDAFIAKFGPDGQSIWARRIGGNSADRATNLATDASNNVYITGQFSGSVDFDPGVGTVLRHSTAAGQDVFAVKLSSAGHYGWSRTIGGGSTDTGEAIEIDGRGAAYVVGTFAGSADFDPSSATYRRYSNGGSDWFLWKLVSV